MPREKKKRIPLVCLTEGKDDIKSINWSEFDKKLPSDRTIISRKHRVELFKSWDPNKNGYLSLAELDGGLQQLFGYGSDVRACISPSVRRAYQGAKNMSGQSSGSAKDYVEKNEFRIFCEFLRYDLYILSLFKAMDTDDDQRVSEKEFKSFVESNQLPGFPSMTDEELSKAFASMDTNHGGMVLYNEFAEYMIQKRVENPTKELISPRRDSQITQNKQPMHSRSPTARRISAKKEGKKGVSHTLIAEHNLTTRADHKRTPQPSRGRKILAPKEKTLEHTSVTDELAAMEKRIMSQIEANHRAHMDKLNSIEEMLKSSNMIGAPTVNQKVKTLISQVATLTTAMNDVAMLIEDKDGGLRLAESKRDSVISNSISTTKANYLDDDDAKFGNDNGSDRDKTESLNEFMT